MGCFLYLVVGGVVRVVAVVKGVGCLPIFLGLVLCYLKSSVCGGYEFVGAYCMGLGSFGCNFCGKKVVPLYGVLVFLILLGFCNKFGSLLVTLDLCHWGE